MAIYNENLSGGVNAKGCTADASKILDGYTAAVGKEIVTGTMPNNGDASTAVVNGAVLEGYTSGGQIEGLTAENIKENVTVAGILGAYAGDIKVFTTTVTASDLGILTVTHNLGYKPTFAAAVRKTTEASTYALTSAVYYSGWAYNGSDRIALSSGHDNGHVFTAKSSLFVDATKVTFGWPSGWGSGAYYSYDGTYTIYIF